MALPALHDECQSCKRRVNSIRFCNHNRHGRTSVFSVYSDSVYFFFIFYIICNSFYGYNFLLFICIFLVFQVKLIVLKEVPEFKVQ